MAAPTGLKMTRILRTVLDICLLRAGPQDLPASFSLLVVALCANVATSWLLAAPEIGARNGLWLAATDAVVVIVLVHFALWVKNVPNRQQQTLIALFATAAIVGLVGWPLVRWRAALGDQIEDIVRPSLLLLVLTLWNLAVIGHILRHALSTTLFNGILLSILYMMISLTIYQMVFAPAT